MSEYRHPACWYPKGHIMRLLRQRRYDAMHAARECHPADTLIYVALARLAHRRILAIKLRALGRGPLESEQS